MTDAPHNIPNKTPDFAAEIEAKANRKRKAQRQRAQGIGLGLGMMGVIGWSVAVPALLGAALGLWLDTRHAGTHSWTLALLVAGLVLGCFNAWRWVAAQDRAMQEDNDE